MGRIAIVTGGTRGIGAAIAGRLKTAGYHVVAVFHGNVTAAEAFHQETGIAVRQWDVSDYQACADGIATVRDMLGQVDILVNNAGITHDVMLHKMAPEQWHAVMATDLTSCFNMCRGVIGGMRERGFGRIVNISSVNGQRGQAGQTNYAAAKAGMLGFTRALALESAPKGITVNAVAPGYIATEMVGAMDQVLLQRIVAQIPVGRLGKPDEVARIVELLVSDDAGYITGATFSANGGQYMA
ncbi:beta-ketoacyl-ACP reductase [Pseudoduganella ginsengisoli]|uniref:Acetoacetyl-CoA reductase n=1 Tax=Pseudoduganella ginsengisoli TaxID=1462440 RepID=A0A6L6Q5Q3_9BURK|nr:acetoacetyl-CoA reductase [Pseudoduganella ginsengisoli]MTW04611.1 acetoacetyl-CoA reductase [Pseudoduganella ginsengisoli]